MIVAWLLVPVAFILDSTSIFFSSCLLRHYILLTPFCSKCWFAEAGRPLPPITFLHDQYASLSYLTAKPSQHRPSRPRSPTYYSLASLDFGQCTIWSAYVAHEAPSCPFSPRGVTLRLWCHSRRRKFESLQNWSFLLFWAVQFSCRREYGSAVK